MLFVEAGPQPYWVWVPVWYRRCVEQRELPVGQLWLLAGLLDHLYGPFRLLWHPVGLSLDVVVGWVVEVGVVQVPVAPLPQLGVEEVVPVGAVPVAVVQAVEMEVVVAVVVLVGLEVGLFGVDPSVLGRSHFPPH